IKDDSSVRVGSGPSWTVRSRVPLRSVCATTNKTGSGVVPLDTRSARHGWDLPGHTPIHIWSICLSHTLSQAPVETIATHSSVYSPQWFPHARELLGTHSLAWHARERLSDVPEPDVSPYTNSITMHAFPTSHRLVSIAAHTSIVSQSCLGPDGTIIFTICYREEAMKMWKVWGRQGGVGRKESAFDKFITR
ncbi:hypothetical protein BJY52DRAFT_1309433, partial [Lactarius psammicola]